MTKLGAALALALASALATSLAPARAEPRFAIAIGANAGDPTVPVLRWAERDAERVAGVLGRVGGVPPEHLVIVRSPSRDDLLAALSRFGDRVRAAGPGALVFVYYSGHADRAGLQLAGTRVSFSELKRAVRAFDPELTVLIVDACRSAGLITAKGGTPVAPFAFDEPQPDVRGLAIVTSSSADEDAQESEQLGGGVFTHHLVAGLIGPADTSGDGRVGLSEAYRYAYAQTLAATAGSDIEQHPTFAFDLHGHDDVIVTDVAPTSESARLELAARGRWFVFERFGERRLVAELDLERAAALSLRPGAYLVRRVDGPLAAEGHVALDAGAARAVRPDELAAIPFRHAVRRGYGQRERRALSAGLALEVSGPLLEGTGVLASGALALQVDLADLAFAARLRLGGSRGDNGYVAIDQTVLGLDAALLHVFELGPHGIGFGLRAGVDWLRQSFGDAGGAPDTHQAVARVGPLVRGEWALGGGIALTLDAALDAWFVEVADAAERVELTPRLVPNASLGLAFLLP